MNAEQLKGKWKQFKGVTPVVKSGRHELQPHAAGC
jgi:hypothetical protein